MWWCATKKNRVKCMIQQGMLHAEKSVTPKKIKTSTKKRSLFKPGEIEGNSVFFFFYFT